jgi:DNA-binding response OmpR family regulator
LRGIWIERSGACVAMILIIDDDVGFRRALKLALRASGHEVMEAGTAPEALASLETQIPQLILLDWQMPGLDGLQTCRAIRANFDVPIIIVTARGENGRGQALAAGAVDYVTKPFELGELLAHVNCALAL